MQQITLKLARALKSLYEKKICHRDLNVNNVMLHFPDLEPRKQDLQDKNLLHRIDAQRAKEIEDLSNGHFEVKIIDFGLARLLEYGTFDTNPCGTIEVIAPEVLRNKSDLKVDVWGIGLISYMMFTS